MRITCTQTFLDGRDRFEAGETRIVDDERAARFIALHWAHEEGADPAVLASAAPADLNIQNGHHGQESTHG